MDINSNKGETTLSPYLSTRSVWALAVGTSVGWGSLVVTGSNYLSKAGIAGSIIGIVLGGLLMMIISRNLFFLAEKYPSAGGVYTYTKNVFGYDRAFLVSWFATLVYISIFWANATSIPLFVRYFFGDLFRFGKLYVIFGYEVYIGEILLTAIVIIAIALLCLKSRFATAHVMFALVSVFIIGIAVCVLSALFMHPDSSYSYSPAFTGDSSALSQSINILLISPWAFIGFESVSHSSEEFNFGHKKLYRILIISVITTTLIYVAMFILSASAYPPEYSSWLDYIRDSGNLEGIKGLPAFYAASSYLGDAGIYILAAALISLVLTSLIGNLRALSRLFYKVAQDKILPERFGKLSKKKIPANAIVLISGISMIALFFGRTAISWIVDITTLGSTLIYGFISAAALKMAIKEHNRYVKITGTIGTILMIAFGAYLLLPNLFTESSLETETYFLLILWSLIGFIYFRRIIAKDHARRFGKAIIVWIALVALIFITGVIWTEQSDSAATDKAITQMHDYYSGTADDESLSMNETDFIESVKQNVRRTEVINTLVIISLLGITLGIMLINYFSMKKWEDKALIERDAAREVAYRDSLTGVKSKHAFVDMEAETDEMIREGVAERFSVVVCDVNGLKYINDTLGHKAGDAYIKEAAALICEHCKHSPVYRVGGDEFVILLEGHDYDNRDAILKEMNSEIEGNIKKGKVVISLGVSEFIPGEDRKFHSVFERADVLMYERKKELKRMGAVTRD